MVTKNELLSKPRRITQDGRQLMPCESPTRIEGKSLRCNRVAGHEGKHAKIDPRSFETLQSWL